MVVDDVGLINFVPVLSRVAGKDASAQFWKYHGEGVLKKYKPKLQVGSLDTKPKPALPTPPASPPKPAAVPAKAGPAAPAPGPNAAEQITLQDPYGDLVPFGDPSWYQSVSLPPSAACKDAFPSRVYS
jgi:hypothetical protein